MNTWFTGDQHFDHKNVIKYDNRPFHTTEEMREELIKRWNNTVRKDDIVWFLGDLSLSGKYEEVAAIVSRLQGRKRMIRGNHDRLKDADYLRMGFEFVSSYPIILKHHFILSHAPMPGFENDLNHYYIYGHVHNHPAFQNTTENSTCICCNRWDYKPIRIPAFENFEEESKKNIDES